LSFNAIIWFAVMFLINLYSRTVTARIPTLVPILVQGVVLAGRCAMCLNFELDYLVSIWTALLRDLQEGKFG
jgi:hypothetical protein